MVLLAAISAGLGYADSLAEALRAKRFQDALTLSGSLLRSQPEDPGVWTARGLALAGLGQDQESISSFETALRYSPEFAAGPRIYDLFSPAIGSVDRWIQHLPRIADMGFDWVHLSEPESTSQAGASEAAFSR